MSPLHPEVLDERRYDSLKLSKRCNVVKKSGHEDFSVRCLRSDQHNEQAWLMMARLVDTEQQVVECLEWAL